MKLEVKNVSKKFKDKVVLNNISLEVNSGEVYGLIGRNGAGKTTLMNIISQLLIPDSGEIIVDGKKVQSQNDLSKKLAYVLDIPCGFEYLTAQEYLDFLLIPQQLEKDEIAKKIDYVLGLVDLIDSKNKKIKTFSRGMKQRMGIASALVFDPEIIILDEPSSALDPVGRYEVLKIITKLKEQNKIVMLSTHILNDVERVCDTIGIIENGVIAVSGKTQDVLNRHTKDVIDIDVSDEDVDALKKALSKIKEVKSITTTPVGIRVDYMPGAAAEIMKKATATSEKISSIQIEKATIEDIFINIGKEGK